MILNHAILHVFDFNACENAFARDEIDLSSKAAKSYVQRLAKKALGNIDNKRGSFAPDSRFAEELRSYFSGYRSFVDLSVEIGEFLSTELMHMEKPVSTDLLVVDFEDDSSASVDLPWDEPEADSGENAGIPQPSPRYFAVMLLESKQAYMHDVMCGESGMRNDIVRHQAILPNPSQKLASYAVVDLRSLEVWFVDKKRTIAGEDTWLIPDGLLQCSMEASSKETFAAVTEIVETVAEEFGANTAVALSRAKAYAAESAGDAGDRPGDAAGVDLDLDVMAEAVFEDNEPMVKRFEEAVQARDLPERVPLEREAVKRVARSHRIVTDTGIELKFPAEYSRSPEYITFTSEADGTISIQLKNIAHIENK